MANGGWYGTEEEWDQVEAPLIEIDNIINEFSEEFNLKLSKNLKDYPERSMLWMNNGIRCLIQIYAANLEDLTWNVWLCASEDRDVGHLWWKSKERYWKKELLVEEKLMFDFKNDLSSQLRKGKVKLNLWCETPENFQLAVKIQAT